MVVRIVCEVAAALRVGPTRERLEQLGYEPVGTTPEEFAAFVAAELPRVAELVRVCPSRVALQHALGHAVAAETAVLPALPK